MDTLSPRKRYHSVLLQKRKAKQDLPVPSSNNSNAPAAPASERGNPQVEFPIKLAQKRKELENIKARILKEKSKVPSFTIFGGYNKRQQELNVKYQEKEMNLVLALMDQQKMHMKAYGINYKVSKRDVETIEDYAARRNRNLFQRIWDFVRDN